MEKNQFVDIAILVETPVRMMKHIGISRNQILDRNDPKGGFSLSL
jgi:hypothetical protein